MAASGVTEAGAASMGGADGGKHFARGFFSLDYDAFVDHCRREYGVHAIDAAEIYKPPPPEAKRLVKNIRTLMSDRDPIGLDRMHYERIAA